MADRLKQIPQKLLDIWKSWSVKKRIIIVSSIVAFIAVVSILSVVLTRPKYQVLVTCEDYTEMNSVTSILTENNHKYKIDNMVVSVNEKELTACKMLLATQDIKSDGYTFEDAMKRSFTTTDSDTPIPPNIGIVNTVSQFSSSIRDSVKLPICFITSRL